MTRYRAHYPREVDEAWNTDKIVWNRSLCTRKYERVCREDILSPDHSYTWEVTIPSKLMNTEACSIRIGIGSLTETGEADTTEEHWLCDENHVVWHNQEAEYPSEPCRSQEFINIGAYVAGGALGFLYNTIRFIKRIELSESIFRKGISPIAVITVNQEPIDLIRSKNLPTLYDSCIHKISQSMRNVTDIRGLEIPIKCQCSLRRQYYRNNFVTLMHN